MTREEALSVLQQYDYGMECPFDHVHAVRGREQWHLCLLSELDTLTAEQLLACLHTALLFSLERNKEIRQPVLK